MSAQSPCHVLHPFSWAVLTVPIFLSHTHCTKTCTHSLTLYQHVHSLPHSHTVRTRAPSLANTIPTCALSLTHTNTVPTHALSPSLTHCSNTCAPSLPHKHHTNMCTLPHSHKHRTNMCTLPHSHTVPTHALSPQRDFPLTNTHTIPTCALSPSLTHTPTVPHIPPPPTSPLPFIRDCNGIRRWHSPSLGVASRWWRRGWWGSLCETRGWTAEDGASCSGEGRCTRSRLDVVQCACPQNNRSVVYPSDDHVKLIYLPTKQQVSSLSVWWSHKSHLPAHETTGQ